MRLIFALFLVTPFANAGVSTLNCETYGSTYMNVSIGLDKDLYHDDSDNGYSLILRTRPRGNSTVVDITVKESSSKAFYTQMKISRTGKAKKVLDVSVADFWLTCSTY